MLPPVWKHHEIWPALMLAAMILFFLDIVLRKLGWKFIVEKWLVPVKEQATSGVKELISYKRKTLHDRRAATEEEDKARNEAESKQLGKDKNRIEPELTANVESSAANMQENAESNTVRKAALKYPEKTVGKPSSELPEQAAIKTHSRAANQEEKKVPGRAAGKTATKQKGKQGASEQQDFTSALLEARKKNKIRK